MWRVSIYNIAFEMPPEQLHQLFMEVGPLVAFELHPDPAGRGPHKGTGSAMFPDEMLAKRAVQMLDNRNFFGRNLKLGHPERVMAPPGPPPGYGGAPPPFGGGGGGFHGSMMSGGPPGFGGAGFGGAPPHAPGPSSASSAPPSLRAVLDSMSPADVHAILSELRALAASSPEEARKLLVQYPVLAQAAAQMLAAVGTLRSTTPAYAAAVGAADAATAAATRTPLTAEEREQVALVRGVLAMSDAEVAAMAPDQREGVLQIRAAIQSPIEALRALPTGRRNELLQLREVLTALLTRASAQQGPG
jgi:hypothetical protein